MLFRKMLREIRMNPGQFISIFLLAAIAMMLFSTFQSSTIGSARALKQMRSDCALADVWMYGEDFSEDDLAAVRALDDVNDAQLRMSITAKSADQGNAQVDVYFEEENKVSMPEVLKGEDFDPSDTEGLWLSKTFADAWDLRPGDSFAYVYNGVTVEKTIRGSSPRLNTSTSVPTRILTLTFQTSHTSTCRTADSLSENICRTRSGTARSLPPI